MSRIKPVTMTYWLFLALLLCGACDTPPDIEVPLIGAAEDGLEDVGVWKSPDGSGNVYDSPLAAPLCFGNDDGVIEASEVPVVVGALAHYLTNVQGQSVPVNPQGVADGSDWVWDFRQGPVDGGAYLPIHNPAKFWFSEYFPGASYATPISLWDEDVLGVFKVESDKVLMLGLGSVTLPETKLHTLMVYDEPLEAYRFPLEPGQQWSQTVTFKDATLMGVKNAGEETYQFAVDGRGTMLLPDFTLTNVLRIRLQLTQKLVISGPVPTVTHHQYMWMHECLGEVARIISLPNEPAADFAVASEFRRLGL